MRIIRIKEVLHMAGISRTTLWRMQLRGEFPQRVALGANSVGYILSEIEDWVKSRPRKN